MNFELEPTDEHLFKTLINDSIGRNSSIVYISRILDAIGGGRTIAIDGSWGSGKTFFIKQWKMVLDSYNEKCSLPDIKDSKYDTIDSFRQKISLMFPELRTIQLTKSCITVYYDAWIHDDENDPVSSLVYDIAKNSQVLSSLPTSTDIGKTAADIIQIVTGRDVQNLVDDLLNDKHFGSISDSVDFHKKVNEFFDILQIENAKRIIVFIDELDRCNPKYAIRLLERIKHYFNNRNVNFVFSINKEQLEQTVKNYYGMDFDAGGYLSRFFDFELPLPEPDMDRFYRNLNLNNHFDYFENVCKEICNYFSMSLRDFMRFYLSVKVLDYYKTKNRNFSGFGDDKGIWMIFNIIVPFMIALHFKNAGLYDDFVNGRSSDEFSKFVNSSTDVNKYIIRLSEEESENINNISKDIYDAIFNNYNGDIIKVGNMEFNKESKSITMDILSEQLCFD